MAWRSIFEGRALRRAFLISLALNFFLVAVGIAVAVMRPPPPPPLPSHIAERMAENLSAQGRQHLLAVFEQHRGEINKLHDAMEDSRVEVRRLFAANPLDTAALDAARAAARENFMAFLAGMDGFLTEAAQGLSEEDRRRLVEGFPP